MSIISVLNIYFLTVFKLHDGFLRHEFIIRSAQEREHGRILESPMYRSGLPRPLKEEKIYASTN